MRSTRALIDVAALTHNLSTVRKVAKGRGVIAMVKANAYGHGIEEVSGILERAHVEFLGVAFVDEAIRLREAGVMTPILVLTPNEPHEARAVFDYALTPVICSIEQARGLDGVSKTVGRPTNGHLYIDTGMHRDGFQCHEVGSVVEALASIQGVRLTGICTHFATADEPDSDFAKQQARMFSEAILEFKELGVHFEVVHSSNTGGFAQGLMEGTTHVRPGLSLYGYQHEPSTIDLRPVMSVVTKVLDIRTIEAGESVSYGRKFVTEKKTRIATLPIGYGDGYLRSLTGKAYCLISGIRYPIVGTICMDECMVDIGESNVEIGAPVVLIGTQQNGEGGQASILAGEVAEWAGTIPYEITTAVTARVVRQYLDEAV